MRNKDAKTPRLLRRANVATAPTGRIHGFGGHKNALRTSFVDGYGTYPSTDPNFKLGLHVINRFYGARLRSGNPRVPYA